MTKRKDRSAREDRAWSWKVERAADNKRLGLLYEPGNWGDVLKGTWAIVLARFLQEQHRDPVLHTLDPFAGQTAYPLSPAAAERLTWIGSGPFVEAQAPWIARGEMASTGRLVREAVVAAGGRARLEVFDTDAERLASWRAVPDTDFLDVTSGDDALDRTDAAFVLIDPYDFFDRWPRLLPLATALARRTNVLVYLYNKSPRGGGFARNYEAMRRRLAASEAAGALVGRIPADIRLPRGYHETLLLGPAASSDALRDSLRGSIEPIAARMAAAGAFDVV